jgi:hypothetical protein
LETPPPPHNEKKKSWSTYTRMWYRTSVELTYYYVTVQSASFFIVTADKSIIEIMQSSSLLGPRAGTRQFLTPHPLFICKISDLLYMAETKIKLCYMCYLGREEYELVNISKFGPSSSLFLFFIAVHDLK